ncbi:MAG: helix-turn-helix domain-containing protein [Clostridia bacterium]|nr:helix-turn-helix domain-containing protein [Clostridia bacterium]
MDISKICERIKERRKELNMTQKDLADAMHVSNQLISKWETGESVPSLEYLQQLSEALNTSVNNLMGEEPSAPAPSEPKVKEPSKVKTFWKKHFKPLLISIISAASALVILMFVLLSIYVFAPSANKEKYLNNIDKGIDKYLERGYFNIKSTFEIDGDEDENPDILQGYIDENGDAVYYNSKTRETVKNKILTYDSLWSDYTQKNYVQPATVVTVSDLLKELLKSWYDDDDDFNLDDVSYIRRSGSGYYLEFSEEFFFEDWKSSEKKNIKLTDKIKGRAEMDGDITKSLEVSVKCRYTVSGENFSFDSKIEFIQEKPIIEHEKGYIDTTGAERVIGAQFAEKLNAVSVKNSLCTEFQEALKDGRLWFDNGSLYTHTYSEFIIFDENNYTVKQKVKNLSLYENYATPYGGAIWYVKTDYSSTPSQYQLCRHDLNTGSEVGKLNFDRDFGFAGNKHYFYANRKSGDGEVNSFVYNMSQQKKIMESKTDTVKCVDDDGRIYCLDPSNNSLYVFGTDKKLKGDEIVRKVDDVVYTQDKANPTVIYKYKAGDLDGTITLPSKSASFNDDYCWGGGYFSQNVIYDTAGNTVETLPAMVLSDADNKDKEYKVEILTICDQWVLCRFADAESYSSKDTYVGLFRLGEQGERSALVAYTNDFQSEYAQIYHVGNKTFLAIYEGMTSYSGLQEFLLIQS